MMWLILCKIYDNSVQVKRVCIGVHISKQKFELKIVIFSLPISLNTEMVLLSINPQYAF